MSLPVGTTYLLSTQRFLQLTNSPAAATIIMIRNGRYSLMFQEHFLGCRKIGVNHHSQHRKQNRKESNDFPLRKRVGWFSTFQLLYLVTRQIMLLRHLQNFLIILLLIRLGEQDFEVIAGNVFELPGELGGAGFWMVLILLFASQSRWELE